MLEKATEISIKKQILEGKVESAESRISKAEGRANTLKNKLSVEHYLVSKKPAGRTLMPELDCRDAELTSYEENIKEAESRYQLNEQRGSALETRAVLMEKISANYRRRCEDLQISMRELMASKSEVIS